LSHIKLAKLLAEEMMLNVTVLSTVSETLYDSLSFKNCKVGKLNLRYKTHLDKTYFLGMSMQNIIWRDAAIYLDLLNTMCGVLNKSKIPYCCVDDDLTVIIGRRYSYSMNKDIVCVITPEHPSLKPLIETYSGSVSQLPPTLIGYEAETGRLRHPSAS
jgi:hypothetical protein